MSAYVLEQADILTLAQATDAMLQMAAQYPGSYPLEPQTTAILGRYKGDLHNLYRALYIANIKAVNGRYGDDVKTLPKYTPVSPWKTDHIGHIGADRLKKAASVFGTYMYQCAEEPIYGSRVYMAFYDVYKLLCLCLVKETINS